MNTVWYFRLRVPYSTRQIDRVTRKRINYDSYEFDSLKYFYVLVYVRWNSKLNYT